MGNILRVNKEVTVSAYYFHWQDKLLSFPKRIQYEERDIEFIENGRQHLTHKGQQLVRLYKMTDGTIDYWLECDPSAHDWKLLSITNPSYTTATKVMPVLAY